MANSITLYSISELLEKQFFIPSYQRGYRWTKQQVEDLLNDLYSFAIKKHKSEKEFYCLQPIVVKKHQWNNLDHNGNNEAVDGWEVVDGQQRLTTIRILFLYFINNHLTGKSFKERYSKDLYTIEYETRKNTEVFLNNIQENDDNIDFYHISETYTNIINWFEQKVKKENLMLDDLCDSILRTLVYNKNNKKEEGVVQVIWYQINEEENAIDTFIRINLGKISLTNSELIKALFLQERFFGKRKDESENEIAKLRQLEIANDWDRIENALQDDDFWWFLNKGENKSSARIGFIFDIIRSKELKENPDLENEIGTDDFSTFRYFYKKFENRVDFDTLKNEWENVKDYFLKFEEWYNNPSWYHYIGFLIYCGESIIDIIELTRKDFKTGEVITTKKAVTHSLKKKIKSRYRKIKWDLDEDKKFFIDLSYGDVKVKELLLLFNLQHIVEQSESKTLLYKFPFQTFKAVKNEDGKESSWDVEHIDSSTANQLNDRPSQIDWLKAVFPEVENELSDNLKKQTFNFLDNKNTSISFEYLRSEIIKLVGENDNDKETKNNIGNLVLLDAGTNRGYGNALFLTKRRKIIEKDKAGVFIPIATKNVFLKYFDVEGKSSAKWTIDDIIKYRTIMTDTLSDFLPEKPKYLLTNE